MILARLLAYCNRKPQSYLTSYPTGRMLCPMLRGAMWLDWTFSEYELHGLEHRVPYMRTDLCFMPMKKNLSLALCLCINIYTYIYIDIDICYIYIRIYTHLFLDLHTHNSVVVGTHTYLYVSVYMYICMDIVVRCTGPLGCNHIYIYIYIDR